MGQKKRELLQTGGGGQNPRGPGLKYEMCQISYSISYCWYSYVCQLYLATLYLTVAAPSIDVLHSKNFWNPFFYKIRIRSIVYCNITNVSNREYLVLSYICQTLKYLLSKTVLPDIVDRHNYISNKIWNKISGKM